MKPNCLGSPKWSMPATYLHRGVWQRIGERLGRPREVLTSDNDQTRCLNLPQLFDSERPSLSCQAGSKGFGVVARSGNQ